MTHDAARHLRLDTLAYGGDYNPDQWPEKMWEEDARLMREAGVNLVSLPVFAWPQLETAPGTFNFGWLDRVIEVLWESGIRVDLATATATPPAWLIREHPEMLPHDVNGRQLEFGSRQAYCPSAPIWRENVARMCRVMADRYGRHPALSLWHISNEYGDHVSRCWCPESTAHFRRWLKARYGSLESLNSAWGTAVWGQVYIDWKHIEAPRTATGPVNPTQLLDFERFSSDALLELFQIEIDVLREVTPNIPVTTNFMSLLRDLNYWDFAEVEDIVTDDAYPDPADSRAHVAAALNYGLMRSLKGGRPWLLLEQASSAVSWRDVNVPKAPGQMRLMSLQAIAHGSDGAMFFQWRQARFGPEKFHSAMVGHRGEDSRSYAETKAFGAELAKLARVKNTRVRSSVAIVVDWDSWWGSSALESLPSQGLKWLEQTRAWHAALYELGHTVDVVRASGGFDGYAIVVVPNLYIATDSQADALRRFVEAGGHLVVGPFSGVVDLEEKVHPRGAPGPLSDLLGVEVDEPWPIPDGETTAVNVLGETHTASVWSEWIVADPMTKVVGTYADGELATRPAVTRRPHGDGEAWYVSTVLSSGGTQWLARMVLEHAGLATRDRINSNLEVVTRSDDETDYVFLLNHGRDAVDVDVGESGTDLLTGDIVRGQVTLGRFGAVVMATPRSASIPFLGPSDSRPTET